MYTHMDVKNSSEWYYCYVTLFYGLWENVVPETLLAFINNFSHCQIIFPKVTWGGELG